MYICGAPRNLVVVVLALLSTLLVYLTSAIWTVCWALGLGMGMTLGHASLRSPNLKVRCLAWHHVTCLGGVTCTQERWC